ncbi:unnamed protein product [Alopecurus aequalis]
MGKRKFSEMSSSDAPGSSWPHAPWRGAGNNDDESFLSDYSGDSRSDSAYLSDDEQVWNAVPDYVGGGDPNEDSAIANMLAFLQIDAEEFAAAEVADHSVPAAAPAPEMVVPAAEPVRCFGCGLNPASLLLIPVEHACLCLPCRLDPSGKFRCEFCDGPHC